MKNIKKILILIIVLALLFICGACNHSDNSNNSEVDTEGSADINNVVPIISPSTEMVPGHIVTEIPFPVSMKDVARYQTTGWDTYGDTIWVGGAIEGTSPVIACYDSVQDQWRDYYINVGDAQLPVIDILSVCETSVWVLMTETPTNEQLQSGFNPDDLDSYIYCKDLMRNRDTCARLSVSGESDVESSTNGFTGLIALDNETALLATRNRTYLINTAGNVVREVDLPVDNDVTFRIGDFHYVCCEGNYRTIDKEYLTYGDVSALVSAFSFNSNKGSYLCQKAGAVYKTDINSNTDLKLFDWMDVVLNYSMMGSFKGLENSQGDFIYLVDGGLICVTEGMVQEKYELTLACFGDSSVDLTGREHVTAHSYTAELMDAVIRFNIADPVYKIKIKPMLYRNESERDRILIELATSTDIDIVDTSLLPDNALDDAILVDLIPYIDNDPDVGRESFIQPLLNAMMKNGKLYEYTDKFAILTTCISENLYTSDDNWTTKRVEELLNQNSEMLQADGWSKDERLYMFAWASTAEFIDWDTMTCSFEGDVFKKWLHLLDVLPDNNRYNISPKLMSFACMYPNNAGVMMRQDIGSDYVVAGFPEAEGNGSYYIKLGVNFGNKEEYAGECTRVGMMASGTHQDGAWRFIKTLMIGNSESNISGGIPVIADRFERALDSSIDKRRDLNGREYFSQKDAQALRDLVYNTKKLVRTDDALINIIRVEANAYLNGQKSADDAARQIQNRISIYLAENE